MNSVFELMESCFVSVQDSGCGATEHLLRKLKHRDWRVRFAAVVAMEQCPDATFVPHLLQLLRKEDASPLYAIPANFKAGTWAGSVLAEAVEYPSGAAREEIEAWRRRGRLKQCACFALSAIGVSTPEAIAQLEKYAVDSSEDHIVRAAACRALGFLGNSGSRAALEKAATDEEWCTRFEAAKALNHIKERKPVRPSVL